MITLNKEDAFTIVDIISKAQEIVRCKDCKYYRDNVGECEYVWEHQGVIVDVLKDDFCSRGERKDE